MNSKTIQKYRNKSIASLKNLATKHFNTFIRERDTDDNGFGRCISSGQPLRVPSQNAHAGHFYSGGKFPELKFNENNVHLQGKSDNYFNGGNQLEYRKNLIKKIGIEEVEELDRLADMSKRNIFKWDRFALIEVIEKYKNIMKARAGFLMLLMSIISFTGFSTTTDLTQNSNAFTLDSDLVGYENVKVIVVISNDFKLNESENLVFIREFGLNSIDLVLLVNDFKNLKLNIEKLEIKENYRNLSDESYIPPLWQSNKIFNTKTSPKLKSENHLLTYRRARDGISCNTSRLI